MLIYAVEYFCNKNLNRTKEKTMNEVKVEKILKNPLTVIIGKKLTLSILKKISRKTKNTVDDEIYKYAKNAWENKEGA